MVPSRQVQVQQADCTHAAPDQAGLFFHADVKLLVNILLSESPPNLYQHVNEKPTGLANRV